MYLSLHDAMLNFRLEYYFNSLHTPVTISDLDDALTILGVRFEFYNPIFIDDNLVITGLIAILINYVDLDFISNEYLPIPEDSIEAVENLEIFKNQLPYYDSYAMDNIEIVENENDMSNDLISDANDNNLSDNVNMSQEELAKILYPEDEIADNKKIFYEELPFPMNIEDEIADNKKMFYEELPFPLNTENDVNITNIQDLEEHYYEQA
jgi:hypothetical protein